ncbi:glycoside hydrolase family 38 C-terminal domain-containing protein [Neobacillus muris]|uniref:glycoside hydrolase family 38 N-terminal domain-containing protein n=1 Tax=Neobacillus muris TaxID=2941334 RepID=UPI00203D99B4|nr:glycoside hydrolase family 38 C-terminal domain-containing protein [Neobacillus muris]
MGEKQVFVVPHSHWDREWYFTIEDSNILLAENLDCLLDVLENDPDFSGYVFDAQASLIEEYLKICPENKERLASLIREKRIFFGPWYTQADTLLVNKESIIRNLLYGTKISKQMGHSMKVGYLPDIFGQNAYLPSIFQGFDIEYSILQRGIYTDQLQGDLNFIWKSPDGKTVKANNLYLGYGPGKFLLADDDYLADRLVPMLAKLAELNQSTDRLLLPAGGDQVLVRKHFPDTIEKLNAMDPQHHYVLSDYETFMEEVWNKDGAAFTNVLEGELLGPQKSRIHNTIGSQRYDIKQFNTAVENKLLYQLEPLAVIARTLGFKYPKQWLDQMWKLLFDVHAHDSIGGCNSDDTNREILHRLGKIDRMADGLLNLLKKQMTQAVSNHLNNESILLVFNTLPQNDSGYMETVVFSKEKDFSIQTLQDEAVPFQIVEQQTLSGGKKIVVTADGEMEEEVPGYYRSVIGLDVHNVPAMGYAAYQLIEGGQEAKRVHPSDSVAIGNEFLEIFYQDHRLTLKHFASETMLNEFLRFEEEGDAGDSYDFSPLETGGVITFTHAELIRVEKGELSESMEVKHREEVPVNLAARELGESFGELEIITTLKIYKGEQLVRVHHEIDNQVNDHRVRAVLKTPVGSPDTSFADQGFSLLTRKTRNPYLRNWREKGFAEAPVPIYPLENFAGVTGENGTLAVLTKGLKEYEVLPETGEFALTLYRSVGLLGRDDLAWRPGRASGINNKVVYTPDAQLEGNWTFDYAIYFSNESLKAEKLFAWTDQFIGHRMAYQKQSLNTFEERLERFEIPYPAEELPEAFSLFQLTNPRVFMSVCKQAFEDDSLIVRLFNPGEMKEQTELFSDHIDQMIQTNLAEQPMKAAGSTLCVPAKGYLTLKLILKDEANG